MMMMMMMIINVCQGATPNSHDATLTLHFYTPLLPSLPFAYPPFPLPSLLSSPLSPSLALPFRPSSLSFL